MDYPLTDKEQASLDKAIDLLLPYTKDISATSWTVYFEEQNEDGDRIGDWDFGDFDTCDNYDCLMKNLETLRTKHPGHNIDFRYYQNDGDHEYFELCSVCGRHLNEFLTWIDDEIGYHIENSITKEDFINPNNAFEISGCLYSMNWNADKRMSQHKKSHNFEEGIKEQKEFIKKIVDYANLIIENLS